VELLRFEVSGILELAFFESDDVPLSFVSASRTAGRTSHRFRFRRLFPFPLEAEDTPLLFLKPTSHQLIPLQLLTIRQFEMVRLQSINDPDFEGAWRLSENICASGVVSFSSFVQTL
jgi:hypothetical protein